MAYLVSLEVQQNQTLDTVSSYRVKTLAEVSFEFALTKFDIPIQNYGLRVLGIGTFLLVLRVCVSFALLVHLGEVFENVFYLFGEAHDVVRVFKWPLCAVENEELKTVFVFFAAYVMELLIQVFSLLHVRNHLSRLTFEVVSTLLME